VEESRFYERTRWPDRSIYSRGRGRAEDKSFQGSERYDYPIRTGREWVLRNNVAEGALGSGLRIPMEKMGREEREGRQARFISDKQEEGGGHR